MAANFVFEFVVRWNAVKAGRSTGKGVRISCFLLLSGTVPDDLIELKVAGHCVDDAPANFRSTLTTHLAPDFFCKFLPHPCLWLQRSKTGSLSFIVDDLMLGTGSTEVQQTTFAGRCTNKIIPSMSRTFSKSCCQKCSTRVTDQLGSLDRRRVRGFSFCNLHMHLDRSGGEA